MSKYDNYSKKDLIIMLERSEWICDRVMEFHSEAEAIFQMPYGRIDEEIAEAK